MEKLPFVIQLIVAVFIATCHSLGLVKAYRWLQRGGRPEFPTATITIAPNLDFDRISLPFLITVVAPQGIYFEEKFATYQDAIDARVQLGREALSASGRFKEFEVGLVSHLEEEGLELETANAFGSSVISFVHTAGLFVARIQGERQATRMSRVLEQALVEGRMWTRSGIVVFGRVSLENVCRLGDEYHEFATVVLRLTYTPAGVRELSFKSMKQIAQRVVEVLGTRGFEVNVRSYYH